MNEELTNNSVDEEISLIDLLAVLIRYRKMIVWGTVAVAVCAFSWLFLIPKVIPSRASSAVEISYYIHQSEPPALWYQQNPTTTTTTGGLLSNAISYLNDPLVLIKKNKQINILFNEQLLATMSERNYSAAVMSQIHDGVIKAIKGAQSNTIEYKFKIDEGNRELLNQFVHGLIEDLNTQYNDQFYLQLDSLYEKNLAVYNQMNNMDSTLVSPEALAAVTQNLSDITLARSAKTNFFTVDESIIELNVAKGRAKTFIIVVFAAFFVLIFAAFLLNAIASIKADPEASSKIAAAWNAGKGKKAAK